MRQPFKRNSAPRSPDKQSPERGHETSPAESPRSKIQVRRRKRAAPGGASPGMEFLESRRLMSAALLPWTSEPDLRVKASDAPVDHLVFAVQPAAIVAGQAFASPVTVDILNAAGAIDTSSSAAVTIAIAGSGQIAGTNTVTASAGMAVFPGLSVTSAGNFKVLASASSLSPVNSAQFTVSPDISSEHLAVTQQPSGGPVGKNLAPAVIVTVDDQFGNVVTDNQTPVILAVIGGPRGGSLTGTTTVTAKNGVAKFGTLSIPLAGTYSLQASDAALLNPDSDPFQFTISQGVTTITAPRTGGAAVFGGTVTLAASLRSTADRTVPFTGAATLLDASNNVLGSVSVDSSGRIKFSVGGLGLGAYECTIAYSGDANHTALVSAPFPLQITAAPTRVAFSSSSSSPVFGQDLQLNAAVTTRFSPSAPPTGTITFFDHGHPIGSTPVDDSGHATLTIPGATIGAHAYSAVYSGDGEFQFSAAQSRNFNVNKAPTLTALRGPANGFLGVGQLLALTANVSVRPPAQGEPTGTVTFEEGNRIIATVPLGSDGSARITTLFDTRGSHRVTAVYSGDAENSPSISNLFLQFVTA